MDFIVLNSKLFILIFLILNELTYVFKQQTLKEPELQLFNENNNVFIYLMQKIVEKNIENKKVDFYSGKFKKL